MAKEARKRIDRLVVDDVTADRVRLFLQNLEDARSCGIATRNQRLTAIHSLARYISAHSPEHLAWSYDVGSISFKRTHTRLVPYLEKREMDAILAAPDRMTRLGERDHALLLFMYNTGARAQETASITVADLDLPKRGRPNVRIVGKGRKERRCPLWSRTAAVLRSLVGSQTIDKQVFLNRRGESMTRFGIYEIVERHARRAAQRVSSLANKRVSPHTIRHTTATHLLRAGVDINTIRCWLGHASLDTTNVYAEVDLKMKADALAKCRISPDRSGKRWQDDNDLMSFLRGL